MAKTVENVSMLMMPRPQDLKRPDLFADFVREADTSNDLTAYYEQRLLRVSRDWNIAFSEVSLDRGIRVFHQSLDTPEDLERELPKDVVTLVTPSLQYFFASPLPAALYTGNAKAGIVLSFDEPDDEWSASTVILEQSFENQALCAINIRSFMEDRYKAALQCLQSLKIA